MIRQDDRTPEQRRSHGYLVVATDRFMSGWGGATGGMSYAAWACSTLADRDKALAWVSARGDMKRVRCLADWPLQRYQPGSHCAHIHIYVWTDR
jgi:hypothetical protein